MLLGAVNGSVNLPALSVGARRSTARLVHMHRDQPGVMSQLNRALADAGINVSLLHLETDAGMGVAVIDLSVVPDENTLDALRGADGTVAAFLAMAAAG